MKNVPVSIIFVLLSLFCLSCKNQEPVSTDLGTKTSTLEVDNSNETNVSHQDKVKVFEQKESSVSTSQEFICPDLELSFPFIIDRSWVQGLEASSSKSRLYDGESVCVGQMPIADVGYTGKVYIERSEGGHYDDEIRLILSSKSHINVDTLSLSTWFGKEGFMRSTIAEFKDAYTITVITLEKHGPDDGPSAPKTVSVDNYSIKPGLGFVKQNDK